VLTQGTCQCHESSVVWHLCLVDQKGVPTLGALVRQAVTRHQQRILIDLLPYQASGIDALRAAGGEKIVESRSEATLGASMPLASLTIFISHARSATALAASVSDELTQAGMNVFSSSSYRFDASWTRTAARDIQGARIVLILLNEDWSDSPSAVAEFALATRLQNEKLSTIIVPIRVVDKASLPPVLSPFRVLDVSASDNKTARIVEAVMRVSHEARVGGQDNEYLPSSRLTLAQALFDGKVKQLQSGEAIQRSRRRLSIAVFSGTLVTAVVLALGAVSFVILYREPWAISIAAVAILTDFLLVFRLLSKQGSHER
jgi:hypothetical protein